MDKPSIREVEIREGMTSDILAEITIKISDGSNLNMQVGEAPGCYEFLQRFKLAVPHMIYAPLMQFGSLPTGRGTTIVKMQYWSFRDASLKTLEFEAPPRKGIST